MTRWTLTLLAASLLAGCHTIHFDRDQPAMDNKALSQSQWHHNMGLALVEVSEPVSVNRFCGAENWDSVKTETTFVNGLPGALIPYLGLIWTPKTTTIQCRGEQSQVQ
ncbi:Bor/Iss family lipoprotein [Ferrimonas gelatinilytica]|uniref:Lipoprotein n=1 Tax=Ferrimonas gelatinilytica TaxID=1255257 RepID=A0ABP9RYR2_9GAMM